MILYNKLFIDVLGKLKILYINFNVKDFVRNNNIINCNNKIVRI